MPLKGIRDAALILLDAGIEGFKGVLTTQKYTSMTHCRAMTFRELDQLQELGIVRRVGQGRAARYELIRVS